MSSSHGQHIDALNEAFTAPLVLQLGGGEVSARRLALLAGVAETGSISGAARHVGMTYKAAWDAIEAMNNLAGQPLVQSQHGGKYGGGARLTPLGKRILATQRRLERVLGAVLEQFRKEDGGLETMGESLLMLRSLYMKTSARNALRGTVENVRHGAVNSEITLRLQGEDCLHAIVTKESAQSLRLEPGKVATAIIKASWVILAAPEECIRISARNRLCGTIKRIQEGAVNAEVVLELPGGNTLAAIITEASLEELGFKVGDGACALIKASHIILAVDD
ncbi:MAG: TOBE domain-containing protein [Gammaproteobacteria bacterium]|nr:TOBE domain-containing protein [Gammaproteobacteria bacterium]